MLKLLSYRNLHHSDTQVLVRASAPVTTKLARGTFKTIDSGVLLPRNLIYQVVWCCWMGGVDKQYKMYVLKNYPNLVLNTE